MKFPIRVEGDARSAFVHIRDADDRIVAGGLSREDAEQLVSAANAGARSQPLVKGPRRKNKRERIAEELKESDPVAIIMERDEIVYGHYDELPQAGESVARLGIKAR